MDWTASGALETYIQRRLACRASCEEVVGHATMDEADPDVFEPMEDLDSSCEWDSTDFTWLEMF